MTQRINRRTFILRAAAGIGATSLACCGLTSFAMRNPIDPTYENFATGENQMNQKVLVAYASRAGSTMEVAQAIANELTQRGLAVDVRPVKQVTSLDGYSAVVVGSAIRMGAWLPDAVKLVEKNAAVLQNLPTAFFAVHLMNLGEDETSLKARQAYLEPVHKLVRPTHEALFAGVGDMSKVSFLEGLIGKMVKSPEGDFRDWKAISGWAQTLFA